MLIFSPLMIIQITYRSLALAWYWAGSQPGYHCWLRHTWVSSLLTAVSPRKLSQAQNCQTRLKFFGANLMQRCSPNVPSMCVPSKAISCTLLARFKDKMVKDGTLELCVRMGNRMFQKPKEARLASTQPQSTWRGPWWYFFWKTAFRRHIQTP